MLVLLTESKKPGAGDQALSRPGSSDLCLSSMPHVLKVPEPPQTVPPAGSLLERGTSDLNLTPFLTSAYRTSTSGDLPGPHEGRYVMAQPSQEGKQKC